VMMLPEGQKVRRTSANWRLTPKKGRPGNQNQVMMLSVSPTLTSYRVEFFYA
jgi:hypothetical protein